MIIFSFIALTFALLIFIFDIKIRSLTMFSQFTILNLFHRFWLSFLFSERNAIFRENLDIIFTRLFWLWFQAHKLIFTEWMYRGLSCSFLVAHTTPHHPVGRGNKILKTNLSMSKLLKPEEPLFLHKKLLSQLIKRVNCRKRRVQCKLISVLLVHHRHLGSI